jgi:hypothetical protein
MSSAGRVEWDVRVVSAVVGMVGIMVLALVAV